MALPWMESLTVWGDTPLVGVKPASEAPVRLAVLFSGNGFHTKEWWAKGEGRNMELGQVLAPLGDFRERVDACDELLRDRGGLAADAPTVDEARAIIGSQVFWWASSLSDAGESAGCDEALALAAELAPELRSSPAWRRLKLKRALPPSVRRALVAIRTRRGSAPAVVEPSATRQIGWWPGKSAGAE